MFFTSRAVNSPQASLGAPSRPHRALAASLRGALTVCSFWAAARHSTAWSSDRCLSCPPPAKGLQLFRVSAMHLVRYTCAGVARLSGRHSFA